MAHVVGVPRRDPCQRCQMPVFLAERLTVGKKVFHRTCLKCARCGSQLTPGSFYETEEDNVFCCETCPDEELASVECATASNNGVLLRSTNLTAALAESAGGGSGEEGAAAISNSRLSVAERLAFFETSNGASTQQAKVLADHKLLQKSVSDEEKSASLKRFGESNAAESPYRGNVALSSFLSNTLDGGAALELEGASVSDSRTDTQMDDSSSAEDSDGEADDSSAAQESSAPPALPSTQPPLLRGEREQSPVLREQAAAAAARSVTPTKRFTATAQLQLMVDDVAMMPAEQVAVAAEVAPLEAAEPEPTSEPRRKTELQLNLAVATPTATTTTTTTTTAAPDREKSERQHNEQTEEVNKAAAMRAGEAAAQHEALQLNLELSATTTTTTTRTNDNHCVTKDKIADATNNATTITIATIEENSLALPEQVDDVRMAEAIAEPPAALSASASAVNSPPLGRSARDNLESDSVTQTITSASAPAEPPAPVELRGSASRADAETTERLSVVRARLQQFEVNANAENHLNDNAKQIDERIGHIDNDAAAMMPSRPAAAAEATNLSDSDSETKVTMNPNQAAVDERSARNVTVGEEQNTQVPPAKSDDVDDVEDVDKLKAMEIVEEARVEMADAPSKEQVQTERLAEVPLVIVTEQVEDVVPAKQMEETAVQDMMVEEKLVEELVAEEKAAKEEVPLAKPPIARAREATKEQRRASKASGKVTFDEYPEQLNPFASDEEDDDGADVVMRANKENVQPARPTTIGLDGGAGRHKADTSNPFDSSDDEVELEKPSSTPTSGEAGAGKVKPPRPPPPRISRNPFGDEDDDGGETADAFSRRSSLSSSQSKKTPVPTPRSNVSSQPQSQRATPEPTPRLNAKSPQANCILQNSSDYYGSANSLGAMHGTPGAASTTPAAVLQRSSELRGSSNSLTSSAGGTMRSRKARKAPAPPPPSVRELFPSTETVSSKASTPSSSNMGTPKTGRKKRLAPLPPKPPRLDPAIRLEAHEHGASNNGNNGTTAAVPKNSLSYPLQNESDSKLSDEEKALLEGKRAYGSNGSNGSNGGSGQRSSLRLIPLDASLLADMLSDDASNDAAATSASKCDDLKRRTQHLGAEETNVVYRRSIVPLQDTPPQRDRQLEKLKDNKETQNRNRQSQLSATSSGAEDGELCGLYGNKSAHGKWKRRKGPAPALPIPPRKVLQMLPLQEIRHELEIIEVQQQGLEKQGVILEKMIRDRCEGSQSLPDVVESVASAAAGHADGDALAAPAVRESLPNSKEVEDLILQLFELVNEKNELFRRQAELMYLRRQHRLEQEQADLEYEIRVLMAQPERNKTDSDKAREEALIARVVEVVQLRNEVIECLEMDRLREAEEDLSIKQRLELHTAQREEDDLDSSTKGSAKLSKKEKKKQKEAKKVSKSKKIDADKDADESELGTVDKQKAKKKKKKFLF